MYVNTGTKISVFFSGVFLYIQVEYQKQLRQWAHFWSITELLTNSPATVGHNWKYLLKVFLLVLVLLGLCTGVWYIVSSNGTLFSHAVSIVVCMKS